MGLHFELLVIYLVVGAFGGAERTTGSRIGASTKLRNASKLERFTKLAANFATFFKAEPNFRDAKFCVMQAHANQLDPHGCFVRCAQSHRFDCAFPAT
jgi:hypothetical protein